MNYKHTYLPAILFLFLFVGLSTTAVAQGNLGIVWEEPDDPEEAVRQLNTFSKLGISYLEIDHPVDSEILSFIESTDFTVLVRAGTSFLTLHEIELQQNQLLDNYKKIANRYRSNFNVAGIGLLSNSQTDHPYFSDVFLPVLDSLQATSNKSFYFFVNKEWYNFVPASKPFGIQYFDRNFNLSDLPEFDMLMQGLNASESTVLFFKSSWFLEAIEKHPELKQSLINVRDGQIWTMPLPVPTGKPLTPNWIVLLLLTLWVALAAQFRKLPYIRPMMMRYFLAHRFFVDDILHYRERAATGGILLMLKHSVFGGIVFYLVSKIIFSEVGSEAFFHHFPLLAVWGAHHFSFFFLGVILILSTQLLAILWLYLPAKNLEHFSQTINLYAGAFYSDFILVTLMVTLYTAGTGSSLILILAVLFVLIWFSAFNIAAYDSSKNMGPNRVIYLLLTIVLHSVFTIALVVYLLTQTEIFQTLELAVSL